MLFLLNNQLVFLLLIIFEDSKSWKTETRRRLLTSGELEGIWFSNSSSSPSSPNFTRITITAIVIIFATYHDPEREERICSSLRKIKLKTLKLSCSRKDILTIFKTNSPKYFLLCSQYFHRLSNIPNILTSDAVKSTLPNQIYEIFQKYLGCKDIETDPSHLKYVSLEYIWDAVEEISKELSAQIYICVVFWVYFDQSSTPPVILPPQTFLYIWCTKQTC